MASYGSLLTGPVEAEVSGDAVNSLVVEMGKLYTAEIIVEGSLKSEREAIAEAIASVRREYPGIIVNYVKIEPRGGNQYRLVVQFFDPRPRGLFPVAAILVIVVLSLIVAALFLSYKIISLVVKIMKGVADEIRKAVKKVAGGSIGPKAITPLEAALMGAAVGGVAGYALGGGR